MPLSGGGYHSITSNRLLRWPLAAVAPATAAWRPVDSGPLGLALGERALCQRAVVVGDVVERQAGRVRRAALGAAKSAQGHGAGAIGRDLDIAAALLEATRAASLRQAAVLVADTLECQTRRFRGSVRGQANGGQRWRVA